MSNELQFQIFFANDLVEPVEVASASDVEAARRRMRDFAAQKPGWYFVWDSNSLRVIARMDTTNPVRTTLSGHS